MQDHSWILEEMYGGISSEILYFPSKGRLSMGIEVNEVKLDYRQLLDLEKRKV